MRNRQNAISGGRFAAWDKSKPGTFSPSFSRAMAPLHYSPADGARLVHLLAGLAILLGTGRTRAVLAENILLQQQLLQQHQSPQRLRALDLFRSIAGNRPLMSFVLICLAAFQHSPVALDRLAVVQHNAKTERKCSRHRLILASKTSTRNSISSISCQIGLWQNRLSANHRPIDPSTHRPIDPSTTMTFRRSAKRFVASPAEVLLPDGAGDGDLCLSGRC